MRTSADTRTYGIDFLRGVACAAVVLFHFLTRAPDAGWMRDVPLRAIEPVARYGYLGVHLFFMISGYVIFMSAVGRTPRAFVASRVARLYPALWISATITMVLVHWAGDPRFTVTLRDYAWNLTLIPQFAGAQFVDGAYWSLAVELQFYVLVWVALRTNLMSRVEWLLAGWLLVALADAIRPMYTAERLLVAQHAPLFVIGASTFLVASAGWTLRRAVLIGVGAGLALWHALIEVRRLDGEWTTMRANGAVVCAVLACAGVIFVLVGVGRLRMEKSPLATIPGILTYPVYLVHQVAGYVVYAAVLRWTTSPWAGLCAAIAFAVAVGALVHYGVEKPLSPRLRRLIAGAPASRA